MAGVESLKETVVRPGQKIVFGTVLAVRLLPELGLDKACPRGFGVRTSATRQTTMRVWTPICARVARSGAASG